MRKLAIVIPFALSILSSGCAFQVGEDEFACPNESKGAACSSARQIHDLTNDRSNLEGLNVSMGKIQQPQQEIEKESNNNDVFGTDYSSSSADATNAANTSPAPKVMPDNGRATNEVYEPLSGLRHDTMPEATLVPEPITRTFGAVTGVENEHGQLMVQRQSPMALAPEPLAVIQQPKTMRVLVAAWTDADGDLHMPGFVYVEVAPKKWLVGEQANDRPGRIVPLQIQQVTQEEERRQTHAKQGASSLGVSEKKGM